MVLDVRSTSSGTRIMFLRSSMGEILSSQMMTWTNDTMMMRKYTTGECRRWISLRTAMKMNSHSERDRAIYAEEDII